jgi:hypothetical protein
LLSADLSRSGDDLWQCRLYQICAMPLQRLHYFPAWDHYMWRDSLREAQI